MQYRRRAFSAQASRAQDFWRTVFGCIASLQTEKSHDGASRRSDQRYQFLTSRQPDIAACGGDVMKRWFGLSVGLAAIAGAAIALFLFIRPHQDPAATAAPTKVTVAQVGEFFIYLPIYYAQERGYFERNGLDVRLVNSGGDDKSVAAVIAGSADFGIGDPTFAAVASQRGQEVRVVASVVNGVPFWGVTKRAGLAPITSPAQLRGLTVATFPRPSTAYVLQERMFRDGGLTPSIREVQFGSLLPLLDTGEVDVVLELEPNVATAEANGARVLYSMAERHPDFAITGVTVSTATVHDRADVVRRFVTALDQAERAGHANPDDVVAYARERFPDVAPNVSANAVRRMLDAGVFPRTARVSDTGWDQAVALRVAAGDLQAGAGKGVVNNEFVPQP